MAGAERMRRPKWWGYIRAVLRDYPRMKAESERKRRTDERQGNDREKCEAAPCEEQLCREIAAVETALAQMDETTKRLTQMVYFRQSHTLQGAAMALYISYATAKRRQNVLIRAVASQFDLY